MSARDRSFRPELFTFLDDLRKHNDRDWFAANKGRYEEYVKGDALQFITDFEPYLHEISPHFDADPRPSGGSLFRIYRDVRFAKDKSPYKTHVGIHFRHEAARDVHAPGFYLHLQPGTSYAGVGIWHPGSAELGQIRAAVAERPEAWTTAAHQPPFDGQYTLDGERLKRPPRGFAADHPLIEDLKWKDFVGSAPIAQDEITAPDFLERYAALCRRGAPFVSFLSGAVGVPF